MQVVKLCLVKTRGAVFNLPDSFPPQMIFFFFNFYLFMIVTERERGSDTGKGRSRLHAPGARRGIRSRVSRIAPWAKGRRQTAAPPRDPTVRLLMGSLRSFTFSVTIDRYEFSVIMISIQSLFLWIVPLNFFFKGNFMSPP